MNMQPELQPVRSNQNTYGTFGTAISAESQKVLRNTYLLLALTMVQPTRESLGEYPMFQGLNICWIALCGCLAVGQKARDLLREHRLIACESRQQGEGKKSLHPESAAIAFLHMNNSGQVRRHETLTDESKGSTAIAAG